MIPFFLKASEDGKETIVIGHSGPGDTPVTEGYLYLPERTPWKILTEGDPVVINRQTSESYELLDSEAVRLDGKYPDIQLNISAEDGQHIVIPLKIDFDNFKAYVAKQITDYLPGEFDTGKVIEVNKSVFGKMNALVVRPKSQGVVMAPALYIDSIYRQYLEYEKLSIADTIEKIAYSYLDIVKATPRMDSEIYAQIVTGQNTWEEIKNEILLKAVPAADNDAFLESVPHRVEGDIAAVYYIPLEDQEDFNCTITINHFIQDMLKVDSQELHNTAVANTLRRYPPVINSMMDFVAAESDVDIIENDKGPQMLILTNSELRYGAAAAFFPGLFDSVSQRLPKGFYVLPSSIHELIILEKGESDDLQALNDMARSINEECVLPQDRLFESVHIYNPETKTLQIAGADMSPEKQYDREMEEQRKL